MQKKKNEINEDGNTEAREIWLDDTTLSEISGDTSSNESNEIIINDDDEEE